MFTLMAWLGAGAAGVVVGLCGLRLTARRLGLADRRSLHRTEPADAYDPLPSR